MVRTRKPARSEAEIAELRAKRSGAARETEDAAAAGFAGLKYEFNDGLAMSIDEDWSGEGENAIAGLQWAGGVALARFIDNRAHFAAGAWAGRRVLEVGAGVGLTSALAALLGAEVTVTDADPDKALDNIAANVPAETRAARVSVQRLNWRVHEAPADADDATAAPAPPPTPPPPPPPERDPAAAAMPPAALDLAGGDRDDAEERAVLARGPFDVVLAGDCCYCPEAVAPLLQTVWRLCSAETRVYLCGIVGDPSLAAFRANVGRWFHVAHVDPTSAPAAALPEEEPAGVSLRWLMLLTKKMPDATSEGEDVGDPTPSFGADGA